MSRDTVNLLALLLIAIVVGHHYTCVSDPAEWTTVRLCGLAMEGLLRLLATSLGALVIVLLLLFVFVL